MAILKYTTKVSVHKTIGEITEILAEHGAQEISTRYNEDRLPINLTFVIDVNGTKINFHFRPDTKAF